MPRRTKTISKSRSRKLRSRTKSRLMPKKKSTRSSYKSKSRRKYRGGCKSCENSKTWKSTGPMYGGSNPEQISKDIYSHVMNVSPYSVA